MNDLPQTFMEPLLFKTACSRGTQARMSMEYLSHVQDADGVTTTCRDRLTGKELTIRSKYRGGCGRRQFEESPEQRRPDLRGQDGRRRLDEHPVRGGSVALRRPSALGSLLGAAARARMSAASAWAWCAWFAPGTNG